MVDKFGHCVNCGLDMVKETVVNDNKGMRKIDMFTSDHDETQYLLDDGTTMRVAMCKSCKAVLDLIDTKSIMDTVINGWKEELKTLPWDKDKKDKDKKDEA